MNYWLSMLALLSLVIVLLTGCQVLDFFVEETPDIITTGEAIPQVEATHTLIDDIVNRPYNVGIAMLIGYASALLRRWYKKKQGMKR